MTAAPPPPGRPALLRFTPELAALLLLAAIAWAYMIREATVMGNGPGTMGLSPAAFLGIWALMMAAMMLPSVAPLAVMHARSFRSRRLPKLASFTTGYLLVWSLTAIPAFALMAAGGSAARDHPSSARAGAAALLAVAGLWQLSSAKSYCLARCRSPIGLLIRYGGYRGRLKEVRIAVHHAGYCLGCCWALMALFVVFGMMNLVAMLGLSGVVLLEKLTGRGFGIARIVGATCLVLAALTLAMPSLAPGLHAPASMPMG